MSLTGCLEEEELGESDWKLFFSHPGYKKPLKLVVNNTLREIRKSRVVYRKSGKEKF